MCVPPAEFTNLICQTLYKAAHVKSLMKKLSGSIRNSYEKEGYDNSTRSQKVSRNQKKKTNFAAETSSSFKTCPLPKQWKGVASYSQPSMATSMIRAPFVKPQTQILQHCLLLLELPRSFHKEISMCCDSFWGKAHKLCI